MAYANAEERSGLISGLRELADFLEQNPGVPAPRCADLMVFPPVSADQEMKEAIDTIAALIGDDIEDDTADDGHYTTGRGFGAVQYRAVGIPARRHALRHAQTSYAENIIPPETDEKELPMAAVIPVIAVVMILLGAGFGILVMIVVGIHKADRSERRLADGARGNIDAATRGFLGAGARTPAPQREEQE